MTSTPKQFSTRFIVLCLYLVFLLSGFSGLVYQVVWTRQFGLIFGVTSYAIGAVLSAFFAGLALAVEPIIQTIQETLGRASLVSTEIYLSPAKKVQRQALQELALYSEEQKH